MELWWENCRIIFCLFRLNETSFLYYLQAHVMAALQISTELVKQKLYPRWKIRMYVDIKIYNSTKYTEKLGLIHKCDVEIIPVALPFENCHPYWFTSLRFILPTLDKRLDAFRLLDCHYLWNVKDVENIVLTLINWEKSGKRCCAWKYTYPAYRRPYCAAVFGLNTSICESKTNLAVDFDFLIYQLRKVFMPRILPDLSTVKYGDDEWLLYMLLFYCFRDTINVGRRVDDDQLYLVSSRERSYISLVKRYTAIQPEIWYAKYLIAEGFITSFDMPHRMNYHEKLN